MSSARVKWMGNCKVTFAWVMGKAIWGVRNDSKIEFPCEKWLCRMKEWRNGEFANAKHRPARHWWLSPLCLHIWWKPFGLRLQLEQRQSPRFRQCRGPSVICNSSGRTVGYAAMPLGKTYTSYSHWHVLLHSICPESSLKGCPYQYMELSTHCRSCSCGVQKLTQGKSDDYAKERSDMM